jgi:hypothetical protein
VLHPCRVERRAPALLVVGCAFCASGVTSDLEEPSLFPGWPGYTALGAGRRLPENVLATVSASRSEPLHILRDSFWIELGSTEATFDSRELDPLPALRARLQRGLHTFGKCLGRSRRRARRAYQPIAARSTAKRVEGNCEDPEADRYDACEQGAPPKRPLKGSLRATRRALGELHRCTRVPNPTAARRSWPRWSSTAIRSLGLPAAALTAGSSGQGSWPSSC